MAKGRDLKSNPDYGPYLSAAFLCEKVITDKEDDAPSAIRIVDRVVCHYKPSSEGTSADLPLIKSNLVLFLSLKTGENPGPTSIELTLKRPDNKKLQPFGQQIHLDSPSNRGANIAINLALEFNQAGVWWFDVSINNVWRTKVPLEVIYLPSAAP
ncbi:MAG: hypothetical protein F4224_09530 [Nitrospira sp. SB0678_bin_10]|nr:hypothetical protein [Nitrospira sp. SB0678_bin_10]